MRIELQKALIGKPIDFIQEIKKELDKNFKEKIIEKSKVVFNESVKQNEYEYTVNFMGQNVGAYIIQVNQDGSIEQPKKLSGQDIKNWMDRDTKRRSEKTKNPKGYWFVAGDKPTLIHTEGPFRNKRAAEKALSDWESVVGGE